MIMKRIQLWKESHMLDMKKIATEEGLNLNSEEE
jgi:hypothetical protein